MHKSYERKHLNQFAERMLAACALAASCLLAPHSTFAQTEVSVASSVDTRSVDTSSVDVGDLYTIQPGDILIVSVWKEPDLQAELLVRPDGGFSFPLAGDLQAKGRSVEQLQLLLTERLKKYIPDPVVTVSVKLIGGSRIYVLGKVNRPGEYPLYRPLDVMQALSLAGGTTPFASVNDIEILRRDGSKQVAIGFRYGDVEKGKALEQNMLLKSGDTVVVP